jgi:hypothetical protein
MADEVKEFNRTPSEVKDKSKSMIKKRYNHPTQQKSPEESK